MENTEKEELIDHLFNSACGYGMAEGRKFDNDGNYSKDFKYSKSKINSVGGKEAFRKCINAIPDEYLDDFIYILYRIAEKSGYDGFSV